MCLGLLVGCGDDGAASGTDGATSTATATPGSSDRDGATVGPTTGEPPPTTGHSGGILDPKARGLYRDDLALTLAPLSRYIIAVSSLYHRRIIAEPARRAAAARSAS